MTHAPQPPDADRRRALAQWVRQHCGAILDDWEGEARNRLTAARDTPTLILRNYLLNFVRHVADALEEPARATARADDTYINNADIHGRLRAATPHFDLRQVITEYSLLRESLLRHLDAAMHTGPWERDLVAHITEIHLTAAAGAFSESLREIQRKAIREISHDMRTPLATVSTNLALVQRLATTDPDRAERYLERAERTLQRLDRMTEDILNAAAIESGQSLQLDFEELDLVETVAQISDTTRLAYGDRLRLTLPEAAVRGRFSRSGVERAVENLLQNAFKYGAADRPVTLCLRIDGDTAIIEVHNWGDSVPERDRARIFDAFERGGAQSGEAGWGLGLSVVAAVADAHGGRAALHSTDDDGTTFCLRLPCRGTEREHLVVGAPPYPTGE